MPQKLSNHSREVVISRNNNFDLLRLFAALQVVILHASDHLHVDISLFRTILNYFPGVPIFFTISGFLISMSLDRSRNVKNYFINRFFRIYPALWVCFIITLILLLFFKILSFSDFLNHGVLAWVGAQVSFFQFYTVDAVRVWGVGTPNGSLWTIPVEIQFYILLPLVVLLFTKIPIKYKLLLFFLISYFFNVFEFHLPESTIKKLLEVSIFPHLFNFIIGSFIYFNWGRFKHCFENKALFWPVGYAIYIIVFSQILRLYYISYNPNVFGLLSIIILSGAVISVAFTRQNLSEYLLKGNDISYGIYIYHMLVVNSIIYLGGDSFKYFVLTILLTIFIAFLSWTFLEKKALKLKAKFQ